MLRVLRWSAVLAGVVLTVGCSSGAENDDDGSDNPGSASGAHKCDEFVTALKSCGVATEASSTAGCEDELVSDCALDCVKAASCDEEAIFFCTADTPPGLGACLESCPRSSSIVEMVPAPISRATLATTSPTATTARTRPTAASPATTVRRSTSRPSATASPIVAAATTRSAASSSSAPPTLTRRSPRTRTRAAKRSRARSMHAAWSARGRSSARLRSRLASRTATQPPAARSSPTPGAAAPRARRSPPAPPSARSRTRATASRACRRSSCATGSPSARTRPTSRRAARRTAAATASSSRSNTSATERSRTARMVRTKRAAPRSSARSERVITREGFFSRSGVTRRWCARRRGGAALLAVVLSAGCESGGDPDGDPGGAGRHCDILAAKLVSCELADEDTGTAGCVDELISECRVACIADAPCRELDTYYCVGNTPPALSECFESCSPTFYDCPDGSGTYRIIDIRDGAADCDDGVDESDCTFTCDDGSTISRDFQCNDAANCPNAEDEENCLFVECVDPLVPPDPYEACEPFIAAIDNCGLLGEGIWYCSPTITPCHAECYGERELREGARRVLPQQRRRPEVDARLASCRTTFSCDGLPGLETVDVCDSVAHCEDGTDEPGDCGSFEAPTAGASRFSTGATERSPTAWTARTKRAARRCSALEQGPHPTR